ncbi:MAG: hypothetical protein KDD61_03180, partial [Bdellovibrionales bacterium]|nr:hypothetical protein [Bdellovibrionales bacterium]
RKMKLPFKILGGGYWYINLEKSRIVIGDSGSRKLKMDIDMDSVKNQLRQGIHSVFSEDSYWMQNFKTYESNMASDFTYQPIPLVDFTEAP